MQSLQNLDNNLRYLSSGLIIVNVKPTDELVELVVTYNATSIYTAEGANHEESKVLEQSEIG